MIQPHTINYPKRKIYYRGGEYPYRSVSCFLKESPEIKIRTMVVSQTLDRIISDDGSSIVPEVEQAAYELDKRFIFFLTDIYFISPFNVIKDMLERNYPEYEILSVT